MKLLLLFLSILFFSACSTKEYTLFQTENPEHISTPPLNSINQDINISYISKIIPDDIIDINIYNMNQKSNILGEDSIAGTTENTEYLISEEGTIFLPLLGLVKVSGLTLSQMNQMLISKYKQFLKQPYVRSKIKNHKIYILGEIATQGVIPIEGNSISIIEAISRAGGFTSYALRDRVLILSKNQEKYKIRSLDFTKLSTLNTQNLMLKPDSIVYIEPKGTKALSVTLQDYSPILQAITTVLQTFITINILKGN